MEKGLGPPSVASIVPPLAAFCYIHCCSAAFLHQPDEEFMVFDSVHRSLQRTVTTSGRQTSPLQIPHSTSFLVWGKAEALLQTSSLNEWFESKADAWNHIFHGGKWNIFGGKWHSLQTLDSNQQICVFLLTTAFMIHRRQIHKSKREETCWHIGFYR